MHRVPTWTRFIHAHQQPSCMDTDNRRLAPRSRRQRFMFQDMDAFCEREVGRHGDATRRRFRHRPTQSVVTKTPPSTIGLNSARQAISEPTCEKHGALCPSCTIVRHSVVAALFFSQDGPLFQAFIAVGACGVPSSIVAERG